MRATRDGPRPHTHRGTCARRVDSRWRGWRRPLPRSANMRLRLLRSARDPRSAPSGEHRLARMNEASVARELFAPLGPTYDRYSALLSLGQDPRWRRFLVSRVKVGADDLVLDVATGTGAVARELLRQKACTVVGVDQSPEMLAEARRRSPEVRFVQAPADALPFPDKSFDALTFTYLFRY